MNLTAITNAKKAALRTYLTEQNVEFDSRATIGVLRSLARELIVEPVEAAPAPVVEAAPAPVVECDDREDEETDDDDEETSELVAFFEGDVSAEHTGKCVLSTSEIREALGTPVKVVNRVVNGQRKKIRTVPTLKRREGGYYGPKGVDADSLAALVATGMAPGYFAEVFTTDADEPCLIVLKAAKNALRSCGTCKGRTGTVLVAGTTLEADVVTVDGETVEAGTTLEADLVLNDATKLSDGESAEIGGHNASGCPSLAGFTVDQTIAACEAKETLKGMIDGQLYQWTCSIHEETGQRMAVRSRVTSGKKGRKPIVVCSSCGSDTKGGVCEACNGDALKAANIMASADPYVSHKVRGGLVARAGNVLAMFVAKGDKAGAATMVARLFEAHAAMLEAAALVPASDEAAGETDES